MNDEHDSRLEALLRRIEALDRDTMTVTKGLEERIRRLAVEQVTLDECVRQHDIMLVGDSKLHARWELADADYQHSTPEPPPGLVAMVDRLHDTLERTLDAHNKLIVGRATIVEAKLARFEAFFGPLIHGKEPPLDGAQVATKEFVDKSLATLSSALRVHVQVAVDIASALVKLVPVKPDPDRGIPTMALAFAHRIRQLFERDQARTDAEEEARNRPSRMDLLYNAVTGRARSPRNGAGRGAGR